MTVIYGVSMWHKFLKTYNLYISLSNVSFNLPMTEKDSLDKDQEQENKIQILYMYIQIDFAGLIAAY